MFESESRRKERNCARYWSYRSEVISYDAPKTITHTMAITYPEATRSRPEAFDEALDRVRVERPWTPRSRLGFRVTRVRVVKRWPERRARGSRATIMRGALAKRQNQIELDQVRPCAKGIEMGKRVSRKEKPGRERPSSVCCCYVAEAKSSRCRDAEAE